MKRPSPAFVIATIALFVALGGTAGAVVTAAVPLAKRALVAENAKKLGGQTSAQITAKATAAALAQSPAGARPSTSAAALVSIKTASASIGADDAAGFTIACDAGQKVLSGGYSSDGPVQEFVESHPSNDTTWSMGLINFDASAGHSVSLYAVCIK